MIRDLSDVIGIFIHIPKTAGKSIMRAVKSDFISSPSLIRKYKKPIGRSPLRSLVGRHPTALVTKNNSFEDDWNRMYKISWVRNPWQRAVSWWNMTHRKNEPRYSIDNFKVWLFNPESEGTESWSSSSRWGKGLLDKFPDKPYNRNPLSALTYVSDLDGNILVDFIGRFEYINEDIDRLNKELNKNFKVEKNYEHIHYGKNYEKYYDDESREYIADICKWEIEKFNYKFEEKA